MEIAKNVKFKLKEGKSVQEILDLISCDSSKSLSAKMKWISSLFVKIGVFSLENLLMQRRMEKKMEENSSHLDKVRNSGFFVKIFENEISTQCVKMGFRLEIVKDSLISENYLKIVKELLEKIEIYESKRTNIGSSLGSSLGSTGKTKDAPKSNNTNNNVGHVHDSDSIKGSVKTRKIIHDIPKTLEKSGQLQKLNQLESEVTEIKNDYLNLTKKYNQLESLYKEALEFSSGKELQKKRVFLLKSQNIQLARYLNDTVNELNSKEGFVHEVDEDIYKIRDILARTLGLVSSGKPEKVLNGISELKLTCQYLEALQRQIHRRIKDHTRETRIEDKTPDFEFMSEFINTPKSPEKVSLADICSGSIAHLNLKHVSRLESQLHTLYDCLLELLYSINSCLIPNIHSEISAHQQSVIDKAQKELSSSINSLLSLSVLIPAAPYPKLDTVRLVGYPSLPSKQDLISSLPSCSAGVKAKMGEFWDHLLHGLNSFIDHKNSEFVAISKELEFHKNLYRQYNQKIGTVVESLEKKKSDLDSNLEVIVPLEKIRENIASLEFNPVKVGDFLASTDKALENVLNCLHRNNL